MSFEITRVSETFEALLTLMRFLTSVTFLVISEISRLSKTLEALLALIRFLTGVY